MTTKKNIDRESYIERTLQMADSCTNEAMRAKYWELAGRALGFLEPPKSENTYIAVFQSVSTDLVNFLKAKGIESNAIPVAASQKIEGITNGTES